MATLRRALDDGCFDMVVTAEPPRNEAVMVIDAIAGFLSPVLLSLPEDVLLSLTCSVCMEENFNMDMQTKGSRISYPISYPKKDVDKWSADTCSSLSFSKNWWFTTSCTE